MTNQPTNRRPFAQLATNATSVYSKLTKRGIYLCALFVVLDVASKKFGGMPAPSKLTLFRAGRAATLSLLSAMASANNVKSQYLKMASNRGLLHMQPAQPTSRARLLNERARERTLVAKDAAIFAAVASHIEATNKAIAISKIVDLVALAA